MPDKISTSALAKQKGIEAKALLEWFENGWLYRAFTGALGTHRTRRFEVGRPVEHKKFGVFIVWPEKLLIDLDLSLEKTLTATQLGGAFPA